MIIFILIRELNINKYMFDEYVIIDMYFLSQQNNKFVMIKIIREIYLIDDLKINILIDNDCIDSKKISVNNAQDTAHINSCNVIINIDI